MSEEYKCEICGKPMLKSWIDINSYMHGRLYCKHCEIGFTVELSPSVLEDGKIYGLDRDDLFDILYKRGIN